MINGGGLICNGAGIVPHTRPERFRDGLHSGFAKESNTWWINGVGRRYDEEIAALVQSIWQAPGRFWYENRPVQPAPIPPLAAPEEDRNPAARPTEVSSRSEETQSLLGTSEEDVEHNEGWMEYIQATRIPFTGQTIGGAAAAVAGLAASTPATRELVAAHPITTGVVVTTGIAGGAYYASRTGNCQGQEGVRIDAEALKFGFYNAEDTQALTVEITCGEQEPVKVVLRKEYKTPLSCNEEGICLKNKLCLYTLMEDAEGKVILHKEVEDELYEAGFFTKNPESKAENILNKMKEKVAKRNPSNSNGRWSWLPGRGNSEEAPSMKPIGYLLIGDVTNVKEVFDQWQQESSAHAPGKKDDEENMLEKLEEAMMKALYKADPYRSIHCNGWNDFEREKGKADGWLAEVIKNHPWLDNIQLRIITNRGSVQWEVQPTEPSI